MCESYQGSTTNNHKGAIEMKRAKKDVVRIGDTSSMYHPRGLESKEAREIYSSLEDHVAAERFRLPWLLAWVSVSN